MDRTMLRLAIALILASACAWAGGGRMLVEEPESAAPPVDPENESGQWRKGQRADLTVKEKALIEARRRKVEAMAERIREKREAVNGSQGEDRDLKTRELKDLILDDKDLDQQEKQSEKQNRKKEEAREKRIEKEKRDSQKGGDEKGGPGKGGKGKSGSDD